MKNKNKVSSIHSLEWVRLSLKAQQNVVAGTGEDTGTEDGEKRGSQGAEPPPFI